MVKKFVGAGSAKKLSKKFPIFNSPAFAKAMAGRQFPIKCPIT